MTSDEGRTPEGAPNLLSRRFREPFANNPGDHIGWPAGRERHDQTRGMRGPSLRACPLGATAIALK